MAYKLIVDDYGKIKHSEMEVLPLTLFVGDNNSGKSLLLSLIWSIMSGEQEHVILSGLEGVIESCYSTLLSKVLSLVELSNANEQISFSEIEFETIINGLLEKNKDNLVKSIFNYDEMTIGKLQVSILENRTFYLSKKKDSENMIEIRIGDAQEEPDISIHYPKENKVYRYITFEIIRLMIQSILCGAPRNGTYYLPAARTGFMLAKNTINQFGRKQTFDFVRIDSNVENDDRTPFPKTIIHFLDSMDNLNTTKKRETYEDLVRWIIENMSKGDVDCADSNSGNVFYTPDGVNHSIPLRVTSGVVTELTPLILLLKYRPGIAGLCYEEPEMCLHPQLQLQMARLLIRMVNSNINVIATTHSDIIVQHINNMCELSTVNDTAIDLAKINLDKDDLIAIKDVAIYQFTDENNATIVKRIMPEKGKFGVPSFVNALEEILNQTVAILDIVEGKEG